MVPKLVISKLAMRWSQTLQPQTKAVSQFPISNTQDIKQSPVPEVNRTLIGAAPKRINLLRFAMLQLQSCSARYPDLAHAVLVAIHAEQTAWVLRNRISMKSQHAQCVLLSSNLTSYSNAPSS